MRVFPPYGYVAVVNMQIFLSKPKGCISHVGPAFFLRLFLAEIPVRHKVIGPTAGAGGLGGAQAN